MGIPVIEVSTNVDQRQETSLPIEPDVMIVGFNERANALLNEEQRAVNSLIVDPSLDRELLVLRVMDGTRDSVDALMAQYTDNRLSEDGKLRDVLFIMPSDGVTMYSIDRLSTVNSEFQSQTDARFALISQDRLANAHIKNAVNKYNWSAVYPKTDTKSLDSTFDQGVKSVVNAFKR